MAQRTCPGKGKKCDRFLSNLYVDGHTYGTKCRGKDCDQPTWVLNVRKWTEPQWMGFNSRTSFQNRKSLSESSHSQNFHLDLPPVRRRWLPVKNKPRPVRGPVRHPVPVRCRHSSLVLAQVRSDGRARFSA